MGLFDRTRVVHGDEGCRDGHYRVKDELLEMVVHEDGVDQKLDPNARIALQAQNPPVLGDVRVGSASEEAAGIPAIWNTMLYGIGDMGVMRSPEAFLKINHVSGFDCQSCAWPSPDKNRKIFEFCENGAKAVSDESTRKRVGPEFFAQYSVEELTAKSDYWLNQQGRLTTPMVRHRNATHYEAISWADAFAMIAEELNGLDSPDQASFYTSGKTMNEPAFLFQLFARQLGTNNLPDCSNMCHESSGVAMVETLGVGKGAATLEDMESSELIFIFGNNPGTNHPRMLTSLQKAKDQGAKIIAVNPLPEVSLMHVTNPNPQDYPNPLELPVALLGHGQALADLYLPVRVNGDVAAIKGILKELFEREQAGRPSGIDHEFIQTYTDGFEALRADVEGASWDEIVEESGLSRAEIAAAAEMYANSKKTICGWCLGVTQQQNGVDNVSMIVNLLLVGGNLGRPGAGTVCIRGHSNVQGDRTMGIWEKPPAALLDRLRDVFGFEPPREPGVDVVESIKLMLAGRGKVFIALGGNFASATPDTYETWKALRQCDLTVHVTTKLNRSHVVHGRDALILPCLGRTEIDIQAAGPQGVTVEDSMSMVHISSGINPPASEHLLSEPAIVARLAAATLGKRSKTPWLWLIEDYDRIRDKIEAVFDDFFDFNERIKIPGGFRLRNTASERVWETESGKATFCTHAVPLDTPVHRARERRLDQVVFTLFTTRSHDQYNTTIYGQDDRYRGVFGQRRVVFINPADIRHLGLRDGEWVDLHTAWSDGVERRADRFKLVAYDIPRGNIAAYYPETNPLVPLSSTAIAAGTPTSKSIPVILTPHKAAGSAQRADTTFAGA